MSKRSKTSVRLKVSYAGIMAVFVSIALNKHLSGDAMLLILKIFLCFSALLLIVWITSSIVKKVFDKKIKRESATFYDENYVGLNNTSSGDVM